MELSRACLLPNSLYRPMLLWRWLGASVRQDKDADRRLRIASVRSISKFRNLFLILFDFSC